MTTTRRKAPVAGKASREAAYVEQQAAMAEREADVTARLLQAFLTHPDREYAEDFYGDMLRERNAYPA